MLDTMKIFKRVIASQDQHTHFLNATEKNISYYFWGKNVNLVKKFTIPSVDMLYALGNFRPDPNNPLNSICSAFTDEISVSEFRTTVKPYPVQGREPYESYSDSLEMYLKKLHEDCGRQDHLKLLSFELLAHGYFGIYFNGRKYYYLTAYDLIPGDRTIRDPRCQPMWIRKTQVNKMTLERAGIDPRQETPTQSQSYNITTVDDLEMFPIYDVWVKDYDINIGFTLSGKVIYTQEFPYPKSYPIFVGNTSELLSSFYTLPIMSLLVEKLKDYQTSAESIQQSAASIAKPMLVYDSDAGINVNDVLEGLKKGYKHILIGKNREGEIEFKAPGQLPSYAQELPGKFEEDIMKSLGLNKVFLGIGASGARERGALARLIKTSFRKLSTHSSIIEKVFTDVDKYAIEYLREHSLTMTHETGIAVEEIFNGPVRYLPSEKFKAYTSEDSYEDKMFTLNQWRAKMIPTETALEQLGDDQPRKTIDKQKSELREMQDFTIELQKQTVQRQHQSLSDKVIERLNGELRSRYWMTPIGKDKMMIKVFIGDTERAAFLMSDIASEVLIEEYFEIVSVPPEQKDKMIETAYPEIPLDSVEGGPVLETPQPQTPSEVKPAVGPVAPETRGRPSQSVDLKKENYKKDLKSQVVAPGSSQEPIVGPKLEENVVNDKVINKEFGQVEEFNAAELESYVKKSQMIYNPDKYKDLSGMYIVEPHAKWIYSGRKMALIMSKDQGEMLDKPLLLCGNKVYGVIILRKIVEDFDFEGTERYHMVTKRERQKWWGDDKIYLYEFEFYPFKFPLDYVKRPGQLTFMGKVQLKDESTGPVKQEQKEIKKVEISPEKQPPVLISK